MVHEEAALIGPLPAPLQAWTAYAISPLREVKETIAIMRLFTSETALAVFAPTGFQRG